MSDCSRLEFLYYLAIEHQNSSVDYTLFDFMNMLVVALFQDNFFACGICWEWCEVMESCMVVWKWVFVLCITIIIAQKSATNIAVYVC